MADERDVVAAARPSLGDLDPSLGGEGLAAELATLGDVDLSGLEDLDLSGLEDMDLSGLGDVDLSELWDVDLSGLGDVDADMLDAPGPGGGGRPGGAQARQRAASQH
jgi:hypothetical protein